MISNQALAKKLRQGKPELSIDPTFSAQVMEKIETLPAPRRRMRHRWRVWVPATAVVLLLIVVVPLLHNTSPPKNDTAGTSGAQSSKESGIESSSAAMAYLPVPTSKGATSAKSTAELNDQSRQAAISQAQSDSATISQQVNSLSANDYLDNLLSNTALGL